MHLLKPGSPLYFVLLLGLVAFGGFQLYLHLSAEAEHARREESLAKPAVPVAKVLAEPAETWAYRRVTVRGRMSVLNSYLAVTGDKGQEGAKVYALIEMRDRAPSPEDAMQLQDLGPAIMADTGYIDWPPPREKVPTFEEAARQAPSGGPPVITYTGILLPSGDHLLSASPDLTRSLWYDSDVAGMAAQYGVTVPEIVFFLEGPKVKGRKLIPFKANWRPDHLTNSIIAFAAAAVLALIFVFFGGRREEESEGWKRVLDRT